MKDSSVKTVANRTAWLAVIYSLVLGITSGTSYFFSFLYNLEQASDSNNWGNELVGIQEDVTAYFYGLLAGAIIVFLIYLYLDRKSIKQHFQPKHSMTVQKLILLIILLAGLQLPMVLIELASEKIGNSPFATLDIEPSTFYSMPLFLYTSFISPLLAELIFRGSILSRLVKHGTAFAILYTSILYAILYVHPIQAFIAIFAGIIFAYVALEHGLLWSTLLHIFNNLVLEGLFPQLFNQWGEVTGERIYLFVLLIFFILSLFILYQRRNRLTEFWKDIKLNSDQFRQAFTTSGFLFLLVGFVLGAIDYFIIE